MGTIAGIQRGAKDLIDYVDTAKVSLNVEHPCYPIVGSPCASEGAWPAPAAHSTVLSLSSVAIRQR